MVSERDEIVIRLDWKHLIVAVLVVVLAVSVFATYVNAMMSYSPSTVSAYAPPIVLPPPNKAPVADAGPDQDVFVNETVYFDGTGSKDEDGKIVEYSWTFGDGGSASGAKVSHRYAAEGVYSATLKVKDDKGASGSASIMITVSEPTAEALSTLSPERSVAILEGLSLNASLDIMMGLNSTLAAEIAEAMNMTTFMSVIEVAISLDQTSNISRILIKMKGESVTRAIIELDPAFSVNVLESMTGLNTTRCALVVEAGVSIDQNRSADILELMETQLLLELLVEITRLPASPQTVATIIEALSIEKAIDLSRAWISMADIQELGVVYQFLSPETLNNVFGSLTVAERASIYPYLSTETASIIQKEALPLPDASLTSFTIVRLGSRGYRLNGTIENQGNVNTGALVADLIIDEEVVRQFEVSDLSAGDSTVLTFEWRPTSRGAYTLEFLVDPGNMIEEIDEANNRLTQTYGVELPDLTVAFMTTPTQFIEGNAYTIGVEISNIGEEEAGGFNLTLEASGVIVEGGRVRWVSLAVGSSEIVRLQFGSSESVDFVWEPEISGAYTLVVRADPSELVLEGDRTNNEVTLQIEVEKRPSLWPYLLVGVVAVLSVLGLFLIVRPETFDFLTKYFRRT